MRKTIFLAAIAAMLIGCPFASLQAADYLPKSHAEGGNVVVGGDQEYRNLYVGGASVAINKQIMGDLFAAGGSVNVAAPVEKDLFAVGGNIVVNGQIGEDARIGGGNITVNSPVGGDLLIGGGTVMLGTDAKIGGDLWIGGGVINLNSPVAGNAKVGGGEIFINSKIDGSLDVMADEKLTFGPQSEVSGTVRYTGRNEAVVQNGAKVGKIDFKKFERKHEGKGREVSGLAFFLLIKLIALFLAGLVILKLFGTAADSAVKATYGKFFPSLGIGLVALIATPIISILLMATLIGFYLGLLLILIYIISLVLAGVTLVFFAGALCEKWIMKKEQMDLSWRTLLWGLLASTVISLIPVLGWLAAFIAFLASLGGMLLSIWDKHAADKA